MPFLPRPCYLWQLRTRVLPMGERTLLMAILNLTPDSFSDRNPDPEEAIWKALQLLDEGADVLDLGAESTRPDATPISAQEEQERLLPVLMAIRRERPEAILSVDTYHAATAEIACREGVEIVNDVSGLSWDEGMAGVLVRHRPGVVLTHTRGRPREWSTQGALSAGEVVPLVVDGLRSTLAAGLGAGLAEESLVLDPGFGFGKRGAENLPLLAGFGELHRVGRPLLAGISRKGFLAGAVEAAGLPWTSAQERLISTVAAQTAAMLAGAHLLRVHDVIEAREAAAIADALLRVVAGRG